MVITQVRTKYEFFPVEKYLNMQGITKECVREERNKLLANYTEISREVVAKLEQINVHDSDDYKQLILNQEEFIAENFGIPITDLQNIRVIVSAKSYELVFMAASTYNTTTAVAILFRNVLQIFTTNGQEVVHAVQKLVSNFPSVHTVYMENNTSVLSKNFQNTLDIELHDIDSPSTLLIKAQELGYPVLSRLQNAEEVAREICLMLTYVYLKTKNYSSSGLSGV